jgi:crotonobetainyl-CoA:carnitine CoA-transferase CaiB-like acyl-CoA transferase
VVRSPGEAKRDPLLLARGETVRLSHPGEETLHGSGLPLSMSGSRIGYDQPAMAMGAANNAVYGELLGYDAEKLATLKRDGVI